MSIPTWTLIFGGAAVLLYAAAVVGLMVAGRRTEARALAGFIPDCIVLFRRLLADPHAPRTRKLILFLIAGYLAMPIDLIPDFIPIAGALDDAIIVALALRAVLRSGGPELIRRHWPGPQASLALVLKLGPAPP